MRFAILTSIVLWTLIITAFWLLSSPGVHAQSVIVIQNDLGGPISTRLDEISNIVQSKTTVVIDGRCMSACTLYLSLPSEQICITSRASFGFHAASDITATNFVMLFYPPFVKAWIESRGGLTRSMFYVGYANAVESLPRCANAWVRKES